MPVIMVTTLSDGTAADGVTTLREAVAQAGSGDVIQFDPSLAGGTLSLTEGKIFIDTDLTLSGDAVGADMRADITIDGNGGGVFSVKTGHQVTFSSLTVTGAELSSGAAVYIAGDSTLTIESSTFTGNAAASIGGAIWNNGTLNISDSTFSYNHAGHTGGAIFSQGVMTATNTTFANNTVTGGGEIPAQGGAICASGNASTLLTLIDCTLTANAVTNLGSGGGIFQEYGSMVLTNTIVSGNTAPSGSNIAGDYADGGGNSVDGDPTLIFGAHTLAYNGGPVGTVALVEGATNPALDIGASTLPDARGEALFDFAGVGNDGTNFADAGAYELQCFGPGTLIATPEGETAVEALRIGDRVMTADGRAVPVLWMGRQTVVTQRASPRQEPVRICAGALGAGLPHSDMVVTADHGMLVEGLLINAGALVNGTTIAFVPLAELAARVTYHHVETAAHEVILANGAPSESFVDYAGRRGFDNYGAYVARYGAERLITEMAVPRVSSRRMLPDRVRARLGHGGSVQRRLTA